MRLEKKWIEKTKLEMGHSETNKVSYKGKWAGNIKPDDVDLLPCWESLIATGTKVQV